MLTLKKTANIPIIEQIDFHPDDCNLDLAKSNTNNKTNLNNKSKNSLKNNSLEVGGDIKSKKSEKDADFVQPYYKLSDPMFMETRGFDLFYVNYKKREEPNLEDLL